MAPRWRDETPLQKEGSARRSLLGLGRIVPVAGLALAPWRRATRLPGASQGQNPLGLSGYGCSRDIEEGAYFGQRRDLRRAVADNTVLYAARYIPDFPHRSLESR